jgi:hypothetical protein
MLNSGYVQCGYVEHRVYNDLPLFQQCFSKRNGASDLLAKVMFSALVF